MSYTQETHATPPVDTTYYDLLKVPVNASKFEIKTAYKKLAIFYHPDKNKSAGAEEKFKQVSEAYTVLFDTGLRRHYNKYGRTKEIANAHFPDPYDFFNKGFSGSLLLKDFIGDLSYGEVMERQESQNLELLLKRQQAREERLAQIMVDRLALYANSDANDDVTRMFHEQIASEGDKVQGIGSTMLHIIGNVYLCKAKAYLGVFGGELPWIVHALTEKTRIAKALWTTVSAASEMKLAAEQLKHGEAEGILTPKEKELLQDAACAKAYDAVWESAKFEIQATLRRVCDMVLYDESVDKATRYKRAEALRIIGYMFSNAEVDTPLMETLAKYSSCKT